MKLEYNLTPTNLNPGFSDTKGRVQYLYTMTDKNAITDCIPEKIGDYSERDSYDGSVEISGSAWLNDVAEDSDKVKLAIELPGFSFLLHKHISRRADRNAGNGTGNNLCATNIERYMKNEDSIETVDVGFVKAMVIPATPGDRQTTCSANICGRGDILFLRFLTPVSWSQYLVAEMFWFR